MFNLPKKYYLIKTKKLKNLPKYYHSDKWVIFSVDSNIIIKDNIYNTHHNLDYINYEQQFSDVKKAKKIILIGKYHHLLPIYRFLKQKGTMVYNIYV